jgi:opacity protein-like surface antigen
VKRIALLLAVAALSSFAGDFKVGADAAGLLAIPSFSGDDSPDSKLGFGGKIAIAGQYDVNEQFAVRASAGYLLTTWGFKESFGGETFNVDATSHFVTIGADAVYKPISKLQVLAGPSVDIPVAGSYSGDGSGDIKNDQTSFLVEAGLGYEVAPAVTINAKYRLPVTSYIDNNGSQVKLHQVQVGVSYNFN